MTFSTTTQNVLLAALAEAKVHEPMPVPAAADAIALRPSLVWALFDRSEIAALECDAGATILRANQAFADLVGYTARELVGQSIISLTLAEDAELSLMHSQPVRSGTAPHARFAKRYRRKDGGVVWAIVSITHVRDSAGRGSVIGQVLDVTALKESEQRLRESNNLAWALFENSPVAAVLGDDEGRIQRVNAAFEAMLGYARNELIGRSALDFTHAEDRALTLQRLADMRQGARPRYEKRYLHKDGRSLWASVHTTAIDLPGGSRQALAFVVDISESRRMQEAMSALTERWQIAAEGAGIGVWDIDLKTGAIVWDDTVRQLYGIAPGELSPDLRGWLQRILPQDRERVAQLIASRMQAGSATDFRTEFRIRHGDGSVRWLRSIGVGYRDAAGQPLRAVGINKDITAQQETNLRLGQMSERLELANEAAGIGVWEWDARSGESYWDAQVRRLWGFAADESCTHELRAPRVHPDDRAAVARHWFEARQPGGPQLTERQFRILRPDGEMRWLHAVARFLRAPDGTLERVLGAEWDVSVQQFATEQVREQAAALKDAQQLARVSSWRVDIASGHVEWSDEVYALAGWDRSRAPPSVMEHGQFFTPESWARLLAALQRLIESGTPIEERVTLVLDQGEKYLLTRAVAQRRADGAIVGVLGTSQDITESTLQNRQVEELSRLPAENPNPILRYSLTGELKYANRRGGAFLASLDAEAPERSRQWREQLLQAFASPLSRFEFACGGQIVEFDCRVINEYRYANLYGRDVTNERAQQHRVQLQATAMNAASNVMFICDREDRIQWVNRAFTEVTGYSAEEAIGQTPHLLKSGQQPSDWYHSMWSRIGRGEIWRGHLTNRRKSGDLYEVNQTITPIWDDTGSVTHFVSVHEDVTERMRSEKKILQLAMFDSVTSLPNRNMFQRHAAEAIARAHRSGAPFALMLLDLDHFKIVNDTLGHAAGDDLLTQVARRLSGTLRESDFVARIGGDEFALLLDQTDQPQQAAEAAQRLLDVFRQPFKVQGNDFVVRGSVGIAMYRDHGDTADTLIKQADLAMYAAKGRSRGGFQFFDAAMDAMARLRFTTEAALHEAMRLDQLALVFQPQVDLASRKLIGSEALLRWHHPERGFIPPAEFVALAEQCGMIFELDDWVLRNALAQAAAWKHSKPALLPLAINLSAAHFDRAGLAGNLERMLREFRLDPQDIELEITESVMMRHSSTVQENVQAIAKLGVLLAVDDFGTGYSSLLSLRDFPVSRLKIDASFVHGIGVNPKDEQIVRAIITLGASLGLKVLAEGVESEAQAAFLGGAGCAAAQGYLFGKPQVAAELELALAASAARPVA